jgi:hypothetical protein
VIATLSLLLALQEGPRIESVERLNGDARRPLLWTALRVTVSSASAFEGRVEAQSSFNFRTAVPVRLAAGGRASLVLPAIDPESVIAGGTRIAMPRDLVRAERVALVDRGLPWVAGFGAPEGVHVKAIAPEDLAGLPPPGTGILEAADLVLPGNAESARAKLAEAHRPPFRFEAVDAEAWSRAPSAGWVESKRSGLLYLSLAYAGLALGLYAAAGAIPRAIRAAAGLALPVLAAGLGLVLVPSGELTVTCQSILASDGEAWDGRIWFVAAERETERTLEFPRLVKPVFPTAAGAESPFTLVFEGGRTRVEGLVLKPGRPACFAGTLAGRVPAGPRHGEVSWIAGAATPAERAADGDAATWSRWLEGEGRLWFLDDRERPGGDGDAEGIAERRERRRIVLERGRR